MVLFLVKRPRRNGKIHDDAPGCTFFGKLSLASRCRGGASSSKLVSPGRMFLSWRLSYRLQGTHNGYLSR